VSNKQSIVAGDGQVSHGNGSITAGGGFYWSNNSVLTNISVNGNAGSVTSGVAYANVDVPDYDPVASKIVVDNVSGQAVVRDYAIASVASGVTDTWHAISVSSNGLVVAAWTRDVSTGKGYVYTSTNGLNNLVKSTALGSQTASGVKVTADGSKIFATHYSSSRLKVSTNNGASWTELVVGLGGYVDASDDGSVILVTGGYYTYMSTNSGSSWSTVFDAGVKYPPSGNGASGHIAVSGDGNVLMFSHYPTPTGALRYEISTNRGVSFVNTITGGALGTIGWGSQYACATRTGNRIYMTCSGNLDNGEGYVYYLEAPNYDTFHNITPKATQFYRGIDCSPDGSGIIALTECSGTSGNGTSKTGTVYVSTNYGASFSSPTNLCDVGTVTTYPRWLDKCAWGDTFSGGYASKGGSGDGKLYRVEVGSVATNAVNILGNMTVNGSVTASGGFSGSGSNLTGITAAQVGAISTNDARYLTGWDDLSFPTESIYAFGLTDIEYNVPSKTSCNTNFSTDHVWLVGQLPHSAKTNAASCNPHIHYVQSSSAQTNMFLIRYKTYKIGAQIPSTWTDLRLTNTAYAYTTGTIHQVAYGESIPGPFGLSQNFDIKIWARGGTACQLKFFDIHYQEDSFGSDAEYSKSF
jgi:ATP-dependent protease HslVU (ClpYQ) peptidase subunit